MSISQQINEDIKIAMKAQDKSTLKVIRMLKAALQKEQLNQSESLSEAQELAILARELKQRKESLREFEKAGRSDLVTPLLSEIKMVEAYLPQQLSPTEIKAEIEAIIHEMSASSADFGKVMGKAMQSMKGRADGQLIHQMVKELLS